MSDTTTYAIADADEIHLTATATATLSDATKLDGLKTFTHTVTTKLEELQLLNSDGWSRQVPTSRSGSGTLAGWVVKGSTLQTVLKTAIEQMTPIYVTVIDNSAAAVGTQKGTRYCFYLESSERPREGGNTVTFSYPLKQHGAPVPVLA